MEEKEIIKEMKSNFKDIIANVFLWALLIVAVSLFIYYLWYLPMNEIKNKLWYEYLGYFIVLNIFYVGLWRCFDYIIYAVNWSLKQIKD